MADNENNEQENTPKPAKSSAMKTLMVLMVVLLLEGGTIGVTMFVAKGPDTVEGAELLTDEEAARNTPSEIHVVSGRYPNLLTGRHFSYDTEVYITVRQIDNQDDQITLKLESMQAQIQMDVATIIRRAEPAYFKEPTLATLRRQIKAKLTEHLGLTDEEQPVIIDVLIPKCNEFRSDF
ncbi:MAG: hypothetical protein ACYTGQ_16555 [Planctomycetota bacterium]|jgi:flagellar basal body-associated protein FliL